MEPMRPLKRLAALLLFATFVTSLPIRHAIAGATCEDHCDTHDDAFESCGQSEESLQAEERCVEECRRQDAPSWSSGSVVATPPPPSGECAETGTMDECSVCCSDHHAAAFEAFSEDFLSCLCQSDVCGSETPTSPRTRHAPPTRRISGTGWVRAPRWPTHDAAKPTSAPRSSRACRTAAAGRNDCGVAAHQEVS